MAAPLHPLSRGVLERVVRVALDEDTARGDLTTEACIPPEARGVARIRAREPLVVAGGPVAVEVYRQVDPAVRVELHVADGDRASAGAVVATVEGPARSLLVGERVALNFLQRLSGVATLTRAHVDALPRGARTRIVDTRKTTPGLRALERYAVRCGGGHNHRDDLGSAVLIKDNHIAASGGVRQAIERARAHAPHTSRIECEVDSLEQLDEALASGADAVLLDNFDDAGVAAALRRVAGRAIVEVSGGITLARIAALGALGVDVVSVGALTHSARAVDLGLDWSAPASTSAALDPSAILASLRGRFGRELEVRDVTGSTMDDVRECAAGHAEGFVVVADRQEAGRGSHGRPWSSPAGTDLYFSILLRPNLPLAAIAPLTLAVGVAVAEAVDALLGRRLAEVKWPNDVLLGRKKCAGILVESRATGPVAESIVVGVGINLNRETFPPDIADLATSLSVARGGGAPLDRAEALAAVLASIEAWYDRFVENGAAPVITAVESRLAFRGERVRCGGLEGLVEGISADGGLRLRTDEGERVALAGRVEPV